MWRCGVASSPLLCKTWRSGVSEADAARRTRVHFASVEGAKGRMQQSNGFRSVPARGIQPGSCSVANPGEPIEVAVRGEQRCAILCS